MNEKQKDGMKGEKRKIRGCDGRKRKYFHKWNNDFTKCKACGATDIERIKALRTKESINKRLLYNSFSKCDTCSILDENQAVANRLAKIREGVEKETENVLSECRTSVKGILGCGHTIARVEMLRDRVLDLIDKETKG